MDVNNSNNVVEWIAVAIAAGSVWFSMRSNKIAKEAAAAAHEANDLARQQAERVAFTITPSGDEGKFVITNSGAVWVGLDGISFTSIRSSWHDRLLTRKLNPGESCTQTASTREWTVEPGQTVTITYHRSEEKWHDREIWTGIVQEPGR